MENNTLQKGQKLIQTLIEKSWNNPEFKEILIKSPETTIQKLLGENLNLRRNEKIVVEDQSNEKVIYLNIPRKVKVDNLTLTDEQLDMVAGGEGPFSAAALGAAALVGAVLYVGFETLNGAYNAIKDQL